MNSTQIIVLAATGAYFLGMILMGIITGRKETHDDFIIASRNVGTFSTAAALAASLRDGMGVIIWFGFAATGIGYGGMWLFLGIMCGMGLFTIVGPRARKMAADHGYITIGEVIRSRIGTITERFTALIILVFAILVIAIQLYVAGHVFADIIDTTPAIGVWSVAAVVAFYMYSGGYSTAIKTDVAQFLIMISFISIPLFFPPPKESILSFQTINSMGTSFSLSLFIIGCIVVLSAADFWQKIFSARNTSVIRKSFPLAGIFLIIMTLSLLFLGMAAGPHLDKGIALDKAFYEIFKGDYIPAPLLAYIAVMVMAVCMSTISPACYMSASTLARNLLPQSATNTQKSYIFVSRIAMLVIMALTATAALTISNVILFGFKILSLLYILFPVYLAAILNLHQRKNHIMDSLITTSVIISLAVYAYMFLKGYLDDLPLTLIPVAISTSMIGLSVLCARLKPGA